MATVQAQRTRRQTERSPKPSANGNRRLPALDGDWPLEPASATPLLTGHDIVDMLYETNIDVFSDIGGECWFRWKDVPPGLRNAELPKSRHEQFDCLAPITSRKMRALLNAWIYVEQLGQPKPGAMNEALLILEGIALTNPAACDLEIAIETNPVLEAVVALLQDEGHWRGMATELLADMNKLSGERGWHSDRHPNWPRNASQLSRALGKLTDLFEDAGYRYEFRRGNGLRHHCFFPIQVAQEKQAKNDAARRESPATSTAQPHQPSAKPNVLPQGSRDLPKPSVAPRRPDSAPSTSAGVSKPVQSPAPPTLVAKFIEQQLSAMSAGSAGDLRAVDPARAPLSKPTDWKRAVKKKIGVGTTH